MSHTQNTVDGAIARSISHNEFVTVLVDDIGAAYAELVSSAEEDVDFCDVVSSGPDGTGTLREVWSVNGDYWRVGLLLRA